MRTTLIALLLCTSIALAQTSAKKPAAGSAAAGNPKAVFDTTAGKLTCTLFPKQAPETVKNFIGLATGTKDWKNPVSHATKHGVPL